MAGQTRSNRRIARNTLALYFRSGIALLVGLYLSRVVLLTLGAEDFGAYEVVGGIVGLFAVLSGALSASSYRFLTFEVGQRSEESLRGTFSSILSAHLLFAVLVVVLAEIGGLWYIRNFFVVASYRLEAVFWVFQFSVLSCFLGIVQVPYMSLLIAHENMSAYASIGILGILIKLVVVLLLFHLPGDKLVAYGLAIAIASVLLTISTCAYCMKIYNDSRSYPSWDWKRLKPIFSYTSFNFIGSMASVFQGQGSNILLNYFFGLSVNAARGIGTQLQSGIFIFISSISMASKPQIIKLYAEGDFREMMRLIYESTVYSFFLMYAVTLPLIFIVPTVLGLWLMRIPEYAVLFARVTLVLALVQCFKGLKYTICEAAGKMRLIQLFSGTCELLPIAVSFIAYKYYDVPAVFVLYAIIGVKLLTEWPNFYIFKRYVSFSIKEYVICVYWPILKVLSVSLLPEYWLYVNRVHSLSADFTFFVFAFSLNVVSIFFVGMDKRTRGHVIEIIKKRIRK